MKFSKELKVALLGIVALAALYVGFLFLKGTNLFSSSRTFYVLYDNVEGLAPSSPVVVNGYRVGLVREMNLQKDAGHKVLVTLDIDKEIDVGDSTIAMLISADLLGGKTVELYLGRNTKHYEGGENLIGSVKPSITDMFSQKAGPVLDTVDSTLVKLNEFLNEDAKKSIQSILLNADATSNALKAITLANQGNINQITSNLAQLTKALQGTESKFNQLASSLNSVVDTLDVDAMNQTIRTMNQTMAEAQMAVKKFNENNGSLGKLMNDDSLYRNLNASSASMNALLEDVKANPKRYVSFSFLQIGGGTKVKKAETVVEAKKVENATTVEKAQEVNE